MADGTSHSSDVTPAHAALTPEHTAALGRIVGNANAVTATGDMAPFLMDWRGLYPSDTPLVLRPGSTQEVADVLAFANAHRLAVVPQGGATGLVGGHLPFAGRGEIILNLGRLNHIREIDTAAGVMTAEAGVTLQAAQDAAEAEGQLFPLSLASEGTCQIGGNLATNAGGINVLSYGNTRELTLGVEAVTAQGEIWNGLRKLRKDNTGYDLKNLLIGSEGTLGVITAATLRLWPKPKGKATALAALGSLEDVAALFEVARGLAGPTLTAFEVMPDMGMTFVLRHGPGTRLPVSEPAAWYVIFDVSSLESEEAANATAEAVLTAGFEGGHVADGVLAGSLGQAQELWMLRELLSEVQKEEGGSIKNDICVPVGDIPRFIRDADAVVSELVPGSRPVPFGHWGDGNIHYNISQPVGGDKAAYLAHWDTVTEAVNDIVLSLNGSISAEHGIGRMKRAKLAEIKAGPEIEMMRAIKQALDPRGILNPGKVV